MRLAIRNALLTGAAAALSIIGAAAAQAETVYVTESGAIASAPGYVYTTPQPAPLFGYPFGASQVIVTDPAPAVITEPSQAITPRERVITREVVAPREQVVRASGSSASGWSRRSARAPLRANGWYASGSSVSECRRRVTRWWSSASG